MHKRVLLVVLFLFAVFTWLCAKKVSFVYEDKSATSVSVAGTFNSWNAEANPLKKDKAGIWKAEIEIPAGSHEYKFVVNKDKWVEDPKNPDKIEDEVGGGFKSVLVIEDTSVKFDSETGVLSFDRKEAKDVWVAGGWNAWGGTAEGRELSKDECTPMKKDKDGLWKAKMSSVPPGVHEYKFVIDGSWEEIPENRKIEIADKSMELKDKIMYFKSNASQVKIAGSWSDWKIADMKKGKDGRWEFSLKNTPSGSYEFKFLPDGNWEEGNNRKLNLK